MRRYATERWETVLHYMVASSQQGGISADAPGTASPARITEPNLQCTGRSICPHCRISLRLQLWRANINV